MLNQQQLETLARLKQRGIGTAEGVISYCKDKLDLPCKQSVQQSKNRNRRRRKHSRRYYQEIIDFMEDRA